MFGGEEVGVGGGEQCGGLVVGLVGALSASPRFPGSDCEAGIAGLRQRRRG